MDDGELKCQNPKTKQDTAKAKERMGKRLKQYPV